MYVHDLRKIIEAIPYDFKVQIKITAVRANKHKAEAHNVYIDFENKELVIEESKK